MPRPIALVTTRDAGGRTNAAPFSFFNVLAEEPPLVVLGIGVSASGGAKDTTNNIRDSGEFVIHLVDEAIVEAMNLCAIDLPLERSEIEVAGLSLLPSERVAPDRIAEAPVALECKRCITLQPGRERYIILGEVLLLHVRDGIVDPKRLRVTREAYAPIGRLFGGGGTTASRCRASPAANGSRARTTSTGRDSGAGASPMRTGSRSATS